MVNYGNPGTDSPPAAPANTTSPVPPGSAGRRSLQLCRDGRLRPLLAPNEYKGIFDYQSSNAISRIPDGTSNTIMFGEVAGGYYGWGGGGGIPSGVMGYAWNVRLQLHHLGRPLRGFGLQPGTSQWWNSAASTPTSSTSALLRLSSAAHPGHRFWHLARPGRHGRWYRGE